MILLIDILDSMEGEDGETKGEIYKTVNTPIY